MDRTERLYQIERLIRHHGHASFAQLQQSLEVSRATLWRDIEYLRSRLGAPIEYDRFVNGYRFAPPRGADRAQAHELPGLWFSERELYALLMAHQLLGELDGDGLLGRHLQPLLERIHTLLDPGGAAAARSAATDRATAIDGSSPARRGKPAPRAVAGKANRPASPAGAGAGGLVQRVRIVGAARRPVPERHFERVAEALLQRRRLHLRYLTRGRGEVGERDVSPQRLVHHRNTWYLDAWCHRARALRRFSLDAMDEARVLDEPAREIALATVREQMDAGYGIYAGGRREWALLRFRPPAAQWVSREQWHPEQRGRWLDDGSWELELPYASETELVMDLLRQGDEVVVVAPASLRKAVRERLQRALGQYVDG